MWLTCPGVLARVEKRKELFSLVSPCFQASICNTQIVLLQKMCLLLEFLSGEYKVLWDNCEFIQNQNMVTEVCN